jgi:predicted PurR-regulated permease PerM
LKDRLTVNISARSVVVFFGIVALTYLAIMLKGLILTFIIAYILATALKPTVNWLKKIKIPRAIGGILVVSMFVSLFFVALGLIFPVLFIQLNNLYDNRFEILNSFHAFTESLPKDVSNDINNYVDKLPQKVGDYLVGSDILKGAFGVLSGFGGMVLFIIISAYMVIEDSTPVNLMRRYWPKKTREMALDSLRAFEIKLSQWVRGQAILSVAIGVLTYIGLSVLGVPYAALLAVIAAVTELIPYIGPWIGGIFGVIIAFTVSPLLAFWVAILYFGIQQFEAAVLVPKVMKKAVGLSPVTILFVITSGAIVFGILGAIISIPIVAGIKAAIDTYLRRVNG